MTEKMPTCEVCTEREAVAVASAGCPYSAAFCGECLQAGALPYFIIVAQTACIGSLEAASKFWEEDVERTLKHLAKSREDFDLDVKRALREMEEAYWDA